MLILVLSSIIFICCITICLLIAYILNSIKEEKQAYKELDNDYMHKLFQCQKEETFQATKLYTLYENEIERLQEQIKEFERVEIETFKANPVKIWNEEIKYNGIYEGKKALIGNYDNFSADMTKKILQNFGLSVERVKTSTDLYEKAQINHYDIIFTNNIYKSGIDGPTLLKQLRDLEGFNTPVIVHTVSDKPKEYFILDLGFDGCIKKPIQIKDVEYVLKKFL